MLLGNVTSTFFMHLLCKISSFIWYCVDKFCNNLCMCFSEYESTIVVYVN